MAFQRAAMSSSRTGPPIGDNMLVRVSTIDAGTVQDYSV